MRTRTLGKIAAKALGYEFMIPADAWDWYSPPVGQSPKPRKGQIAPSLQIGPESVTIADLDYAVTFYVWFGRQDGAVINGVEVKGWSDTWDNLNTILDAWEQSAPSLGKDLRQAWQEKKRFLTTQPG